MGYLLHKIIDKLDKIDRDIQEIKTDIKLHPIQTDDNFIKLYHLVEEKILN